MFARQLPVNCFWVLFVAVGFPAAASGQTDMGTALYGRGVHAYFSGHSEDAANHFNSAIALQTRDPRVYYFRGLTFLRQGRQYEAEADFNQAAQLEFQGITTVNVGRALERIQGQQRLQLEKVRRQTHAMLAQQRAHQTPQAPMIPAEPDGDPQRLRTPVREGSDTIQPIVDAPGSDNDPFADDNGLADDAEVVEPSLPDAGPMEDVNPGDEGVNPFDDDAAFSDPATGPADVEPPAEADEGSPFDAFDTGVDESPFEEEPDETPADTQPTEDGGEPAGDQPAEIEDPFADEDNLFGDG